MRGRWAQFGGQLGVGVVVLGVVVIFFGWNGAASWDRVQSQFPYLISGGMLGLAIVVVGAALMIVQSHREDRARLEARLVEVREALERLAAAAPSANGRRRAADADVVLAGPTSFHLATCRLLEGRSDLPEMSVENAQGQGLRACRVCNPLGAKPRASRSR